MWLSDDMTPILDFGRRVNQGADTPVPVPVPVPDLPGDGDGTFKFVPDLPGGGDTPPSASLPDLSGIGDAPPVSVPVPDLLKSGTRLECCEYPGPKGAEVLPRGLVP